MIKSCDEKYDRKRKRCFEDHPDYEAQCSESGSVKEAKLVKFKVWK